MPGTPEADIVMETLSCGCRYGNRVMNGEPQFVIEPCSLDCQYYKYAIDETKRQGKPVFFQHGEEVI